MLASWTVLHCGDPTPRSPWAPDGATWWQSGHSSAGRAQAPQDDGRWWSVLATWDDRAAAADGPPPGLCADTWHVVLEPLERHGDVVLADGARPFDDLRSGRAADGPVVLITVAGRSDDDGRAREFSRRFVHVARDIATAPGHLVSLVHGPAGDPESGPVLTFSAWRDARSGTDWAYSTSRPHVAAVARQRTHGLVRRSGSVRCAVVSSRGSLGGAGDPLAAALVT